MAKNKNKGGNNGNSGGQYRVLEPGEESHERWGEYWSERATNEDLLLSDYYPQKEGETDEDYEARLQKIQAHRGELALHSAYKFIKAAPSEHYNKEANIIFAERLLTENALADMAKIRAAKDNRLKCTTEVPNDYEKRQGIARFYVGPLDILNSDERQKIKSDSGVFETSGSERYTTNDAAEVIRLRQKFIAKELDTHDKRAFAISGKMFEGFFYPLVASGFFDLPSKTDLVDSSDDISKREAAFVASSEYDDYKNGVDVAAIVPIKTSSGIIQQPICFDLTTSTASAKEADTATTSKIDTLKARFAKNHGLTDMKYPSTCLNKELPPITDVPHFTICLPREELGKFTTCLAKDGGGLTKDLKDLINYQIYRQAEHWAGYWHQQTENHPTAHTQPAELFANISNHFQKLAIGGYNPDAKVKKIEDSHPRAIKFLIETGIIEKA